MPVIRVEMFKRTQEEKRNLVRELTEAFINTFGGNKEAIKILITEVDKTDWASGGYLLMIKVIKNCKLFASYMKENVKSKKYL